MNDRPNIILLIGEDAGRALGCYGDADARTPNLDHLATEGCRYDNAFTTAPVCSPSRATLVTGRYPWSLGVHHHRSTLLHPPRLVTHELRDAGYHVHWPGKTDFNFEPSTGWRDSGADWLDELRDGTLPNDQPLFLYRNLFVTHESTMWGPHQTDGAHEQRQELRERFGNHQPDPASVHVPAYLPDVPAVRTNIARFYEGLAFIDREVGEILAALEVSPLCDNTVVIYLTDHGRGLLREKRWCYGAGIHLSLVIRWPGRIDAGSVERRLVSWVDLAPTLLSLAGAPVPEGYEGQVFLGPDAAPPRAQVFAGRGRMDESFDHVRVVRDSRFHYIRNGFPQIPYAQRNRYMERMETTTAMRDLAAAGQLDGPPASFMAPTKPSEELYDAVADPDMVRNLADDPACVDVLAELRRALDAELARTGDLGAWPERELIRRGLVANRLDGDHDQWVAPLPAHQQPRVHATVLEMPES